MNSKTIQMKNKDYNNNNQSNKQNNNYNQENEKLNNIKITAKITIMLTFIVLTITIMLITLFSTIFTSNLAFLKHRFYVMESATQPEIAEKGDLVIAKKVKPGEVVKGDKVVYAGNNFYYCDSVVETRKVNTVYKMIIAEKEGIRYQFEETEIEGKVVKVIPKLGDIALFLRTPLGITFFIIFTVCVFLLLRILLFRINDYDKKSNNK